MIRAFSLWFLFSILGLQFPNLVTHIAQAQTGDETANLISYLTPLIEEQMIGDTELNKFIHALDRAEIINLIPHQRTARYGVQFTKSAFQYHYERVQHSLDQEQESPGILNRSHLLQWAKSSLKEKRRVREQREETRQETQTLFEKKMRFHPIEPGTFQMETGFLCDPKAVQVQLTQQYDLMSTQVTQWQWAVIEGSNPSEFKEGDQSIVIDIRGHSVTMQPDHPVESVSWDDVQKYILKLNRLSVEEDALLKELIPDHRQGDQFRLPTDAEWSYVAQARGGLQENASLGDHPGSLKEFAWFKENSGDRTHPVAQLKPWTVDGHDFYDLLGNVWEWVGDYHSDEYFMFSSFFINPQGPPRGTGRRQRGWGWRSVSNYLLSGYSEGFTQRSWNYSDARSSDFGFRLLRIRNARLLQAEVPANTVCKRAQD